MWIREIDECAVTSELVNVLAEVGGHPEEFGERQVVFVVIELSSEGFFEAIEHGAQGCELLLMRTTETFFEGLHFDVFEAIDRLAVTQVPAVQGGFGDADELGDFGQGMALRAQFKEFVERISLGERLGGWGVERRCG